MAPMSMNAPGRGLGQGLNRLDNTLMYERHSPEALIRERGGVS